MSGFTFAQVSLVQQNFAQSGYSFVAPNYSLGSPSFATPDFGKQLSASAYSLGSPTFATPPLTLVTFIPVNAYSLGSPSFTTPSVQQNHVFTTPAFSIGSPAFVTPVLSQNHILYANSYSLTPPLSFAKPALAVNYSLAVNAYSLGSPIFGTGAANVTGFWVSANSYDLGSPRYAFPRLGYTVVVSAFPPLFLNRVEKAVLIVDGMLNRLMGSIPSTAGVEAFAVRRLISIMREQANMIIRDATFGTRLGECYDAAFDAGADFDGVDAVRAYLMQQDRTEDISNIVVNNGLLMTLALESRLITLMTFKSRDAIQVMIDRTRAMFDEAKDIAIDDLDASTYQTFNALGRAVLYHLASTELQLPRVMKYHAPDIMPSLALAQRIYADGSRADEITDENVTVHPAFCQMDLTVLSK